MSVFNWIGRMHRAWLLRQHPLPYGLWRAAVRKAAVLQPLSAVEKARLRTSTILFLRQKTITGAQGFEVTGEMAVLIAAQAVLPVLRLGLDYYRGWSQVIVYPAAFRVNRDTTDEQGLVSREARVLSGEAWSRGPVVLSWADVLEDLAMPYPGHNVVIHEFAHKLDMLNGVANGMPPLHSEMDRQQWTRALGNAYEILQRRVASQQPTRINAYAATTPAEYFAVVSEYFFTAPALLQEHCADVFAQLKYFYRQNPTA